MDDLGQRQARAAERILGNERLTDNLDDEAAQVLLDWGLACAEKIVHQHAESGNEAPEEERASRRLRAVRRMMRQVSDWAPRCSEQSVEENAASLAGVLEQVQIVYGDDLPTPDDEYWRELLIQCDELATTPKQLVSRLRALVEGQSEDPAEEEPPCLTI
jgi:hypothetical protein